MDYLELMEAAKRAQAITSDYRLGKVLGVSENTMYNYRHGLSRPDELRTFKLCKLAGVDPAPWLFDLYASRAKEDELKDWWATLGKRMSPAVLAVMFCLAWLFDRHTGADSMSLAALPLVALPSECLYIMSTVAAMLTLSLLFWLLFTRAYQPTRRTMAA